MNAPKILLAEDDASHQFLLLEVIRERRPHFNVTAVRTPAEVLDVVKADVFDCVVTDFNLGSCQADEILSKVKELAPNCPTIVISSSEDQNVVIKSMRNGSVDFVPKSAAIADDVLCRRIDLAMRNSRKAALERRRRARRQRQLKQLAEKDPLTGLYNRRYLDRWLGQLGRQTFDRRYQSTAIMMDLDHFKNINDTHGHDCGDRVLQVAAETVRSWLRNDDIACRWGGEEFVIIQPLTELAESVQLAELLRQELQANLRLVNGVEINGTASFGLANCRSGSFDGDIIRKADGALYLAKRDGRNRVCTWDLEAFRKRIDAHGQWDAEPDEKLRVILNECWNDLGPTQREHLTAHSQQVSEVAMELGTALGLSPAELQQVAVAGLMHDLGKVAIPERVLAKPAELDGIERSFVDRHATEGARIAAWLGVDAATHEVIQNHHRRYDQIHDSNTSGWSAASLSARVLNAADSVVAMLSDRPYRKARTLEQAVAELKRERGRQFDPDVVDALLTTSVLQPQAMC